MRVEVGDMVYIPEYKRPFRVKARDNRYIICTKPYNPQHTVIYFIIDLQDKWIAPDDSVFCIGACYDTTGLLSRDDAVKLQEVMTSNKTIFTDMMDEEHIDALLFRIE